MDLLPDIDTCGDLDASMNVVCSQCETETTPSPRTVTSVSPKSQSILVNKLQAWSRTNGFPPTADGSTVVYIVDSSGCSGPLCLPPRTSICKSCEIAKERLQVCRDSQQ